MKKTVSILIALSLALTLAACGSSGQGGNNTTASTPPAASEPSDETQGSQETIPSDSSAPDGAAPQEDGAGSAPLIACFSWSGNTEALAGMIQAATGGDLFAIEPETPYTDDYDTLLDVAQQEQADNARPAVAGTVENWEDYDTVFVGYPNWWGDAPRIVLSFLESYDCTGKTVIPFATSGGGGFGGGIDSITASAAGATILEGFHVSGSRVDGAQADVEAWLAELGY